jgi:CRISPR system Cascade subunit CasE
MYLSKIEFSPSYLHEMVKHLRKGLFHEHQMIWELFPNDKQAKRDFLYCRNDQYKAKSAFPFYYVLSARKPDNNKPEFIVQSQPFSPQLKQGDNLQFSLRTNAVKMVRVSENSKQYKRKGVVEAKVAYYKREIKDSKDMPPSAHIHYEAGNEWLIRQGEKCGFQVKNLLVENHQFHKIKKPKVSAHRQFSSLDLRGQIQITNSELFIEKCFFERDQQGQLIAGLGRSKAFGCGLMLIRRA